MAKYDRMHTRRMRMRTNPENVGDWLTDDRARPQDAEQIAQTLHHNPHMGGNAVTTAGHLVTGVSRAFGRKEIPGLPSIVRKGESRVRETAVHSEDISSNLNRAQFFQPEHFAGVVEGTRDGDKRKVRNAYSQINLNANEDLRAHAHELGLVTEQYTPKPPQVGPLKPVSRALENNRYSLAHFDKEQ